MAQEQPERPGEHPSTYVVQDRSNQDELTRLHLQDQLLTEDMGGLLPEQDDPTRFRRVLDVGCGTGGWLIALAKAYPTIESLDGVDVSASMVNAARAQAEAEGVNDRVKFYVMDALRMLEFPRNYFDLVNHRFNFSYLRTWDWPNLLQEYQRVARWGGIIRITEPDVFAESNSEAFNTLAGLVQDAFMNAGHLFAPGHKGVTDALPGLLHQQEIADVQIRRIHTSYTRSRTAFINDMRLVFRTILPFLRKWTRVPDNYDQLYQQVLKDLLDPDFRGHGEMVTVWGKNVQQNEKIPTTEHRS